MNPFHPYAVMLRKKAVCAFGRCHISSDYLVGGGGLKTILRRSQSSQKNSFQLLISMSKILLESTGRSITMIHNIIFNDGDMGKCSHSFIGAHIFNGRNHSLSNQRYAFFLIYFRSCYRKNFPLRFLFGLKIIFVALGKWGNTTGKLLGVTIEFHLSYNEMCLTDTNRIYYHTRKKIACWFSINTVKTRCDKDQMSILH